MPELPEVETVVTGLRPFLLGQTIRRIDLRRLDIVDPLNTPLPRYLKGRTIQDLARRGKKIVFTLNDANRFFIHLGMSGQLTIEQRNSPMRPHTHLLIDVGEVQVRFVDPRRFGGVWWIGKDGCCDANLGPEPLGLKWQTLASQLERTRRAIKVALLDQSVIAGIGNIYADEALFASGIHPLTPANALTREQIIRLNRAIQQTLRRAIKARGSTLRDYRDATGGTGGAQFLHRVYDRAGKPCPTCKRPIERIVLGGRSTHFCSNCQQQERTAKARRREDRREGKR